MALAFWIPGPAEMVVIAAVGVVFFGPWAIRRLFGTGVEVLRCAKEVKRELREAEGAVREGMSDEP